MADEPLLEVKDLIICYETDDGVVKALNGVNVHIDVGETSGLVGKTGAGKITLAKGIMRLAPNPPGKILDGEVIFEGQNLLRLSTDGMEVIRGRNTSIILQDPMISLSPMFTVGERIMGVIENHNTSLSRQEARKWVENVLERVGIPTERFGEYPHQFSGGMKQRVVIAIALVCDPRPLITDGPITALGVIIQAQALGMIYKFKSKNNTSMILITHGLGVVAQNCGYVIIIYVGKAVEYGALRGIYKDTRHPYTKGLFGSIPSPTNDVKRPQATGGMTSDSTRLPKGCVFCERCKYTVPECSKTHPRMVAVGGTHQAHCIRCR